VVGGVVSVRAKALAAAGVLLGSSCAEVVSESRREPGPLLRSFERPVVKEPAGLRAEVHAQWPSLEVRVLSSSVCRTEVVREYDEEVVTERSAKAAGPSLVLGVTTAAVGAALLLFRGSISSAPDTSVIDGSGHYGASPQQIATGWGIGLVVVGVPSIALGALGLAQSGEGVSKRLVDQVSDVKESRCDEEPVNGKLAVVGPGGPQEGRATQDGKVTLPVEALRGTVVGLSLDGQPVALDAEDEEVLEAFRACARVLPLGDDAALGQMSAPELVVKLEAAQRCAVLPGAGGTEAVERLSTMLGARAPASGTFEETAEALSPSVTLTPESADLAKLWRGEVPDGTSARLRGSVVRSVEPNLVLVEVGAQDVLVETDGPWPERGPRRGQRVEAVGVLVGRKVVGEIDAPLLMAMSVRAVP
jgi:hypothetical protein